ncbi:MAG: GAF domain-containing SpoIIE family protein phosphatase [Thermoleophilia bacterium]
MPSPPPDDELAGALTSIEPLIAARSVDEVLRAVSQAACRATASRRGVIGLFDGEAATSDGWYDVDSGWNRMRLRWDLGQGGPGRVCASGMPLLHNAGRGSGQGRAKAGDPLGLGGFVCVPIAAADGGGVGFLAVGGRTRGYGAADLQRLGALARLAGHRLQDVAGDGRRLAEMHAAQADIAERLQQRLLPGAPPELAGLDVAFLYRSASTGVLSGGDFVDYYSRSPNTLAFAIGDVSGKGVEAMATTFATKYILRAAVHGGQLSWPTHPGEALQELRTGLLEQPDYAADSERFVTVLFGLVSTSRGLLQLASAGHPTPFVVRAGGAERPLLFTEPAIGVELGAALAPYPTENLELERGDLLVAFTDGVTELRGAGGHFFEDEMAALLAGRHDTPAADVVAGLMAAAEAFSLRPPADDLAILCIRLTAGRTVN